MTLQLFARVQALIHCRGCQQRQITCPTCGEVWSLTGSRPGAEHTHTCSCWPGLETLIAVEVVGYFLNPTGERPPSAALSDDLQRLARCWARPAARRPAAPQPAPRPQPMRWPSPAPQPRRWTPQPKRRSAGRAPSRRRPAAAAPTFQQPCPPEQPRWRFARFTEVFGWIPEGVTPAAVAAAYVRLFGVPARRDPTCHTFRAYSAREMRLALDELSGRVKQQPTEPH